MSLVRSAGAGLFIAFVAAFILTGMDNANAKANCTQSADTCEFYIR